MIAVMHRQLLRAVLQQQRGLAHCWQAPAQVRWGEGAARQTVRDEKRAVQLTALPGLVPHNLCRRAARRRWRQPLQTAALRRQRRRSPRRLLPRRR